MREKKAGHSRKSLTHDLKGSSRDNVGDEAWMS